MAGKKTGKAAGNLVTMALKACRHPGARLHGQYMDVAWCPVCGALKADSRWIRPRAMGGQLPPAKTEQLSPGVFERAAEAGKTNNRPLLKAMLEAATDMPELQKLIRSHFAGGAKEARKA